MNYYLLQLGCQMNIADGERIRTVLSEIGCQPTDDEQRAQIVGVVACSVRQKAIDKVYSKIHQWNSWKKTRQLITFATGCILPADRERLLKKFDLVFGIEELQRLPHFISQYGVPLPQSYQIPTIVKAPAKEVAEDSQKERVSAHRGGMERAEYLNVAPQYGSQFEAYVPIQNGCDKFCTFCAVPYTRGREVSRPSEEVYAEVERLLTKGYKTITLLGQNVNSYGLDTRGREPIFTELLERVALLIEESGARCWLYFTSPHPRDFNAELFQIMARHPAIAAQVHLPLQSGDDKLLIRMNRKHSMQQYRALVRAIRTHLPRATLFTDIIVGFCGESEEQFMNTRRAMQEFRYNMAYIAQYSPRPGAASSRWEDDIPSEVKKARYRELTMELHKSAFAYNRDMIGTTVEALVIGRDRKAGFLAARTEGRITMRFPLPEEERGADSAERYIGQILPFTITAAHGLSLEGKVRVKDKSSAYETSCDHIRQPAAKT